MRIVLLAYACEPGKGSEPGTGWMWARLLARFGEVTVITRSNNRDAIESAELFPEASQVHFEYVDLPPWAMKLKQGRRRVRLYYFFWQSAALKRARALDTGEPFDLAWHVTLANIWMGSSFGRLSTPLVLGPMSGGVPSCWRISIVGGRGLVKEIGRSAVRTLARYANPRGFRSWSRAKLILTNNEDTSRWLPRRHRGKAEVFPNVVLELDRPAPTKSNSDNRAMYAGDLLPLKGLPLALRALTYMPGWTLDLYGDGPDKERLGRIAAELNVADRVRFHGWVAREEVFRAMSAADVLLFPSLHDEVGWVVAEALALGLPVVSLDRGGPASLGATAVRLGGPDETATAIAEEAQRAQAEVPRGWDLSTRSDLLRKILESRGVI